MAASCISSTACSRFSRDTGVTGKVFAVVDIGTTVDDEGGRWPTAVIDVDGHPEIGDLARVHAVEGIGDITTQAAVLSVDGESVVPGSAEHVLALSVSITVPVTVSFAVAFLLPAHREVLDAAMRHGHVVIATTPPDHATAERPLWLAVDIDAALLAYVLPR